MNDVFVMTISDYLEIVELAQKNGVKPGESMAKEFAIVLARKKESIKHLGQTNDDIDLIAGNLRENGVKVYNVNEERRNENK